MAANGQFIERYFAEMGTIIHAISRDDVDRAVELLLEAWRKGTTVFIMGNGGSASTATHFACDPSKQTIVGGKTRGLLRGGGVVAAPWGGGGGPARGGGGGWSQNIIRAINLAKERGA